MIEEVRRDAFSWFAERDAAKRPVDGPRVLRRRPLTVEAWQVTEANRLDVAAWSGGIPVNHGVAVYTDTGDLAHADFGDWIVRSPFGDFYPAPDKLVFASYEAIVSVISE